VAAGPGNRRRERGSEPSETIPAAAQRFARSSVVETGIARLLVKPKSRRPIARPAAPSPCLKDNLAEPKNMDTGRGALRRAGLWIARRVGRADSFHARAARDNSAGRPSSFTGRRQQSKRAARNKRVPRG